MSVFVEGRIVCSHCYGRGFGYKEDTLIFCVQCDGWGNPVDDVTDRIKLDADEKLEVVKMRKDNNRRLLVLEKAQTHLMKELSDLRMRLNFDG